MTTEPWTTSRLLQCAATIADRLEAQGQPIDCTEALERAAAAQLQMTQLEAMRDADIDWADTLIDPTPAPPLAAGVSA